MQTAVRFAAAIAFPAAGLLIVAAQNPSPANGVRILYPASRSAHAGAIRIIVAADKSGAPLTASLDGKPLELTRMPFSESWAIPGKLKATSALVGERANTTLWSAEVTPTPGPHELECGNRKLLVLGLKHPKQPVPKGWMAASAHRLLPHRGSSRDCATCHEMADGALGSVATPEVCSPCHDETSVQLIHGHVPQPLAKCALCHDPHGASLPKLLIDTKQKLCAKCHGSGHFRG